MYLTSQTIFDDTQKDAEHSAKQMMEDAKWQVKHAEHAQKEGHVTERISEIRSNDNGPRR